MAEQRLEYLKRKMERNDEYKTEYSRFMNEMIANNFCERVPLYDVSKPSWYIPHHGVYHRVKKKIRVVFDCSAKYNGKSLNECLVTGPDLINSLLGILLRFGKNKSPFNATSQRCSYSSKFNLTNVISDRKSTRLNSSHNRESRMPSSA